MYTELLRILKNLHLGRKKALLSSVDNRTKAIGVGGRLSNCCLYVSSYSKSPDNFVTTFLRWT